MRKRFLSVLTAFCLLTALMTVISPASSADENGGYSITGVPVRAVINQELKLTYTVNAPEDIDITLTWSVIGDGGTGASIKDDIFTARSPGIATVRAVVSELVLDENNETTSNKVHEQDFQITVYPAPFNNISVSVNYMPAGTATASSFEAMPGETVFLSAEPNPGYYFDHWQITSGDVTIWEPKTPDTYFIMPASEVAVTAVFVNDRHNPENNYNRYTVLVLDVSDSMRGTPLAMMKDAAVQFCESVIGAGGDNKIAVISYSSSVTTECDFTSNIFELRNTINGIELGAGQTKSIYGALERADALLDKYQESAAISKNIVLLAHGLPYSGHTQNTGKYMIYDHASYQYCNAVYSLALRIQGKVCNIYSVGYTGNIKADSLAFYRRFMRDIQNAGYYEAANPSDFPGYFRSISSVVLNDGAGGASDAAAPPIGPPPSSWAAAEVNEAIRANLVPRWMQMSYTDTVSRAEYCALAVRLCETVWRTELQPVPVTESEFSDTTDINIRKLESLPPMRNGSPVIQGIGDGRFDPDGLLTREQAATLLAQLADAMGRPMSFSDVSFFDDWSHASSWAKAGIGQIHSAGVMQSIGYNYFAPKNPYTREQSIITMLRMRSWLR